MAYLRSITIFAIENVSTPMGQQKSQKAEKKFTYYQKPDFNFENIFKFIILFSRACRK
jgi:hypothetical protein